jgi:hypothetical protein
MCYDFHTGLFITDVVIVFIIWIQIQNLYSFWTFQMLCVGWKTFPVYVFRCYSINICVPGMALVVKSYPNGK